MREAVHSLASIHPCTFYRPAAFFGLAGTRVATRARSMLLRSLLRQDMAFFDGRDTGELTNRLSVDCSKFSSVVSSHINVLLRQTIQVRTDGQLSLRGLLVFPSGAAQAFGACIFSCPSLPLFLPPTYNS